MKKTLVCMLLLVSAGMLSAQSPVKLNVVNAKGKSPGKAIALLKSNSVPHGLNKDTPVTLHPAAGDTIFLTVGNNIGSIPTDGQTDITVVTEKGRMSNQATGAQYAVVKLPPFDPNNIGKMPNLSMFVNLENLISVKFPSVKIQGGQAYLLSNMSAGYKGNNQTPMLIVVDGSPVQSFGYVNEAFSVQEIKSIVVKRSDVMYGMRGEGGIMEITLLSGRDR